MIVHPISPVFDEKSEILILGSFPSVRSREEGRQIYVNGKAAYKYYCKYSEKETGRNAICLPSTSPANAAWSLERLINAWSCIKEGFY